MKSDKLRLLEVLRERSVSYGDFTLSSGKKSKYYVDAKLTTYDSEGVSLVGRLVFGIIKDKDQSVSAVGGLTMGADPIAISTIIAARNENYPLRGFTVRKEPKSHGKKKLIEGNLQTGDSVAVLDDVITTGSSTIKAIKSIKESGGSIAMVIALVDRREGGTEAIEKLGCKVHALFTIDQLLDPEKLGGLRSDGISGKTDSVGEQRLLRRELV